MSQIILDCGSGNSCKNDLSEIKKMIDAIVEIDTGKHEIIFKWQLWSENNTQGNNIRLHWGNFTDAYNYAKSLGYKTTASVFDKESLDFLLEFDIPLIKIANRRSLDWLIGEIPRRHNVIVSGSNLFCFDWSRHKMFIPMLCVSKYPSTVEDYMQEKYEGKLYDYALSDHTENLDLYNIIKPEIYECHFCLDNQTGLDADSGICKKLNQLKEIL